MAKVSAKYFEQMKEVAGVISFYVMKNKKAKEISFDTIHDIVTGSMPKLKDWMIVRNTIVNMKLFSDFALVRTNNVNDEIFKIIR